MKTLFVRHDCAWCAVWRCSACGWTRRNADRLAVQTCGRDGCYGSEGEFLPVQHVSPHLARDHDEEAERLGLTAPEKEADDER